MKKPRVKPLDPKQVLRDKLSMFIAQVQDILEDVKDLDLYDEETVSLFPDRRDYSEDEVRTFETLVEFMARGVFGADSASWCPVQSIVNDRSRAEKMHFVPVPDVTFERSHDPTAYQETLRMASINMNAAWDSLSRNIRMWESAQQNKSKLDTKR